MIMSQNPPSTNKVILPYVTFTVLARNHPVTCLKDLFDFKVLMVRKDSPSPFEVRIQADVNRKILRGLDAKEIVNEAGTALLGHFRTLGFIAEHGDTQFWQNPKSTFSEIKRMYLNVERMLVRDAFRDTRITGVPVEQKRPGQVTVVVRLPRGVSILCVPKDCTLGPADETPTGHVKLFGHDNYFYLRRPAMTSSTSLCEKMLQEEFFQNLTETFPFISFNALYDEAQLHFYPKEYVR